MHLSIPEPEMFAEPHLSTVVTFDNNSIPSVLVEMKVHLH